MQTSLQPLKPVSGYIPKSSAVLDPAWVFTIRNPHIILPAVFAYLGEHGTREGLAGGCKLWCLVRSYDNPINGGSGRGIVNLDLDLVARLFDVSYRTIFRYLRSGKQRGFFRYWRCKSNLLTVIYSSPTSIALNHQLEQLGAVVEADASRIGQIKTLSVEGAIEQKQAQSYTAHRKEWGKFAKGAATAGHLLSHTCNKSVRVLARGKRLLYLAPDWRPFGASQIGIAADLGISPRTVQYHTCKSWREVREIPELEKAQAAHQINEDMPKAFNKLLYDSHPEKRGKWVFLGSRMFEVRSNLYSCPMYLRPYRYRKAFYRDVDYPLEFHPEEDLKEYQRVTKDYRRMIAEERKEEKYRHNRYTPRSVLIDK